MLRSELLTSPTPVPPPPICSTPVFPSSIISKSTPKVAQATFPPVFLSNITFSPSANPPLPSKIYPESYHFSSPLSLPLWSKPLYSPPLCPHAVYSQCSCHTSLDKMQIKSSLSLAHDLLMSTSLIQRWNQKSYTIWLLSLLWPHHPRLATLPYVGHKGLLFECSILQ